MQGKVIVWCDYLCAGPVRKDIPDDQRLRERAEFLSSETGGKLTFEACIEHLGKQDRELEKFTEHDEIILWFDACAYDQTIMIRQLDWFAGQNLENRKLYLICAAEFPGFKHFRGLGELAPEQLASLLHQKTPVTAEMSESASRAFGAFCSDTPREMENFISRDDSPLLYLNSALRRLLEEYPSVKNGLGRLENEILETVSSGYCKLRNIFTKVQQMEKRPFFGDTTLFGRIHAMASVSRPLLKISGPGPLPLWNPPPDLTAWTVLMTENGKKALEGKYDWIEENGVDRWLGGTHLTSSKHWRFNSQSRQLAEY